MTEDEALRQIVDATLAKVRAEQAIMDAIERREDAVRDLYKHVDNMSEMERRIETALVARGVAQAKVKGLGVGLESIRRIVGRRKRGT